jgi:enamine deaminase RidA (YjgF/YER057c/UK114 family)
MHPGDIGAQTAATLAIIETALVEAGFAMTDVVRIRMFVTDMTRSAEVMTVQGAAFASIRPAATLVEVSALIDPSLLIEIEADAVRD